MDKLDNYTAVIYRNYKDRFNLKEIIKIKEYCKKKRIRFYISNSYKIALKLGLDGAYIPSFNKNFGHLNFCTKPSFSILGSAHNLKEIRIKEKQGVKFIFISSVFKKNKNYLGTYRFRILKNLTRIKVVALGGFSKTNKKKINLLKCSGFSGISYFE